MTNFYTDRLQMQLNRLIADPVPCTILRGGRYRSAEIIAMKVLPDRNDIQVSIRLEGGFVQLSLSDIQAKNILDAGSLTNLFYSLLAELQTGTLDIEAPVTPETPVEDVLAVETSSDIVSESVAIADEESNETTEPTSEVEAEIVSEADACGAELAESELETETVTESETEPETETVTETEFETESESETETDVTIGTKKARKKKTE